MSVAWDASGERLASGSGDKTVKLWEAASGKLLRTLEGHANRVLSVAWDPSGERLASGSDDQTVKLWEAASGKLMRTLEGHANGVWSVAWDPSGERLASGSYDQTVKLWEASSGKLLRTLEGHEGLVRSVAWTPDGRRLAVATTGGWIDIWYVPARGQPRRLGRLVELAGGLGFALTADGYVDGPPAALEHLRFVDGWAVYDVDDLPERVSPERVAAAYGKR